MSDSLPLIINPWLMCQKKQEIIGTFLLSEMPYLRSSQNKEESTITACIAVKRREDGHTVIIGEVKVELEFDCQRCLQPMIEIVKTQFELVLVKFKHQLSSINEDNAIVCENNLKLIPMIEQELILSLPIIAKHRYCQAIYENAKKENSDRQYPFTNLKKLLN